MTEFEYTPWQEMTVDELMALFPDLITVEDPVMELMTPVLHKTELQALGLEDHEAQVQEASADETNPNQDLSALSESKFLCVTCAPPESEA